MRASYCFWIDCRPCCCACLQPPECVFLFKSATARQQPPLPLLLARGKRPYLARSSSSSKQHNDMEKRGPKLGDAASLWNFTPSPGWTKEESLCLKLCLMRFGIGSWVAIQGTGLLPGKLIQQLNGATQRLLGQQSLAAFSGLKIDIDRVRAENAAKADARRKNGLIIWSGSNPTKEMKLAWQQEAREKYGLTAEQQAEADAAYEQMAAAAAASRAAAAEQQQQQRLPPNCDVMGCDVQQLSVTQKQQLVCTLHRQLEQLVSAACQQQPGLTQLTSYFQQPRMGWIVLGVPLQLAAAADGSAATDAMVPHARANLLLRQPGVGAAGRAPKAAAAAAGGDKTASKRQGGRPPTGAAAAGRKRGRSAAASAARQNEGDDDDFLQAGSSRRRARSSSSNNSSSSGGGAAGRSRRRGGGDEGGGGLSDLMRVALEAGVAQLLEMGYSRSKAVDALRECHCDVEAAVEYLTAACC